ncbi:MAG: HAD superfamily hydrolase (TIGR01509 family) [Planctomycetota bacterium]|jgi:HAD superfamily hydrolase (TIGR01509 family)
MAQVSSRPILLFDVMSTLVYDPFYVELPAHFGMTFEEMLACKHPDAWERFETGEWDEAVFLPNFFKDGRSYDHAAFKSTLAAGFRWLDGMLELTTQLKRAGFKLHALSNYPPWYQLIEERLSLSRVLDGAFVSFELGVRKPADDAYLIPAQRLGVEAGACLFIDDQDANCRAARGLGMDAILFQDSTQLRAELSARDLI